MSNSNSVVMCENFDMWNMSIFHIFGKTSKIKWSCGECGSYNEDRIAINAVECGRPHTSCRHCGTINYIPICYHD